MSFDNDNCKPDPLKDPFNPSKWNEQSQRSDREQRKATNNKQARELAKLKKEFNKSKNKCKTKAKSGGGKTKVKIKVCICPVCNPLSKVLNKISGKNFYTIPFTTFKIPRFDHLLEKTPTFDENRRPGEKCGACNGTRKIPDPTDDTAKYQQAAQRVQDNAEKIMKQEAKLGLGGARTTVIQGNDTLFVGLGFNNNKTYEVVPDSSIAPAMRGNKIPQQGAIKVNTVVGKQGGIAWPQQVGNYTIKCANKFNLIAGAGGVTIATPGPLTFSAGITRFTGPQISIGCNSGPLTLEGDSINISGKTVTLTPTNGTVFIKGSIANTGNITTQGHAHFESLSFPKASCVGVTKSTYQGKANPDVFQTRPAAWGASALKGALSDLKGYFQSVPTDGRTSAFRTQSPQEQKNISARMASMAPLGMPWEGKPTGFILPGTAVQINASKCPCNYNGPASGPIQGTFTALVPINNIPHVHGIPEMMHKHDIVLPDMDYTADSAEALRDKTITSAQESGVPADPTRDTQTRITEAKRTGAEFIAAKQAEITRELHKKTTLA
jgi:hypothetical protein